MTISINAILLTMDLHNQDLLGHVGDSSRGAIEWEASEYVHHEKGALWIIGLVLVALLCVAIAAWFRLWMFAALLAVMAITFGYFGMRKPRVIKYKLSDSKLSIGQMSYPLNMFKAFGVIQDGALYTVRLIPTKRFAPAIMIYFAEEDGERIVDILGAHMPMEKMRTDVIDVLMRQLRF